MAEREKIFVTGAKGQLGSSFRDISNSHPQFDFLFVSRDDLPVEDSEKLQRFFMEQQPDWLINCAAYTSVDRAESEKDKAMLINGEAVGVMAQLTAQHNCGFIHISTDYVFNGLGTTPYKEEQSPIPQNNYGFSKMEGERKAIQFNPHSLVIRSSWIYSEHGNNFVKTMMRLMKEKESISVVNDQFGSPTYARDLAEIIMCFIIKGDRSGGIYHFCNKGIISWYEFALAIKELSGSSCRVNPISTAQFPTPAKRPTFSALDTSKISKKLETEMKEWRESLKECMERM